MILSNLNRYKSKVKAEEYEIGFKNFEALNMLSAAFSMMFTILNCLLIALTFETNILRFSICGIIVTFELGVLIYSNFIFTAMSYTAWTTLGLSIVFYMILLPFYGYVILTIINEQMEETMQTVTQKDFF